ncbi:hypothetical protein [Polyangium sorediatum]|uniref:Lipoprotein n=1 Tax=Polyangium sorediatum TaxID=889274 RepID=A0ABT6P8T5_9BACT|nr:hypothetical protein [Polyangium sorediatum]MDI1436727.1 hypothetical protein [Polyangium sorediatum]
MRISRPVDHALRSGLGRALLVALTLVHGCAPVHEGEGEPSVEPFSAEAEEELETRAPVGLYRCTLSGGLISGTMVAYPGPWGNSTCTFFAPPLPGSSKRFCSIRGRFMTCPDCQALRIHLACPFRDPI